MIRWTKRKLTEARSSLIRGLAPEIYYAIGGGRVAHSKSGIMVTADEAMKVAAFKRGVCLIGDYIGKTPFHVKQGHSKATDHPAWKLVRRWAWYHGQSAFEFRRTMTILAQCRGNSYARIVRNQATMEPLSLRILDPSKVEAVVKRGTLRYQVKGRDTTMPASNVIHIKAPSLDGFHGMDPISQYGRDVLGLAIAQQNYASRYYENGGVPSTYLKSEVPLGEDQWNRLKGETGPLKTAVDNPHDIPVLEQAELKSLNLSAEQTQLLGAREFSLKDIANILGLPVHKLQGDGKSSYKSLEEENRAFREDTLDPWLCQFEFEFAKLLTEDQQLQETHEIHAVRESLTRTNIKDRQEYLGKGVGVPWMTPNEGREIEGLEGIEGGDELQIPLNMIPPDTTSGNDSEPADDDEEGRESIPASTQQRTSEPAPEKTPDPLQTVHQLRALTDVYGRMSKRLATQARKAAAKPKAFQDFLDNLDERNQDTLRSAFGPVCGLCATGSASAGDDVSDTLLADFRTELNTIYDTTPADAFTSKVNAAADTFEQSARTRADNQLMEWLTA